jgi:hypothetical protein
VKTVEAVVTCFNTIFQISDWKELRKIMKTLAREPVCG